MIQTYSNFKSIPECCETVIVSANPSTKFDNFQAFGVGTYKKDSVDSRDRIIYRNAAWPGKAFGLGDFILYYEGPNVGGRQNWVVGIRPPI